MSDDPFDQLDTDPESRAVIERYGARMELAQSIMATAGIGEDTPSDETVDTIWSHAWRIAELRPR